MNSATVQFLGALHLHLPCLWYVGGGGGGGGWSETTADRASASASRSSNRGLIGTTLYDKLLHLFSIRTVTVPVRG